MMTNHLAGENSPYLLQHAANPVEWYPWGAEALEKARTEDKPIFLSIGYAACHWCHVMAHESFEDADIAALMNREFVNIKVDREERPDLDGIYMQAVVALTGHGGWPMSVFLTPDGTPFYGGTYFPPVRRYNMPAFGEVLQTLARLWHEDRARLLQGSRELAAHLQQRAEFDSAGELALELLEEARQELERNYDWQHGGWGRTPKFPQPMTVEFLLRLSARGSQPALQMASHALQAMARGGMYDVVGGGFARYATDDDWRVPHFEKMLYDNAQLARVYLQAWLLTGAHACRRVCEETLDFLLRELADPAGGFYSSLDADSEGEEGKFYLWTAQEVDTALGGEADAAFFQAAYAITAEGNFEGRTVLQRALGDEELAQRFGLPLETIPARLAGLHSRLLAVRSARVRPATDDKVLTAWNGLALLALAEAARYLGRADYLAAAQKNGRFLLDNLWVEGRLLRSWRAGKARHNAYLEDHAALALGLLALYQSDGDAGWYEWAYRLAEEMLAHFADPRGGFFDTRDDHEAMLMRPRDVQDNATPSGSALAAELLLLLAAYEGRPEWHERASRMIAGVAEGMLRYPTAFARWLCAADLALGPLDEVALVGAAQDERMGSLRAALWGRWRPRLVSAWGQPGELLARPALLQGRGLIDGMPTAYVCQDFACRLPVNLPGQLAAQLDPRADLSGTIQPL